MRSSFILLISIILFISPTIILAEASVPIEPGEWEMTSTTTSDSLDAPNVQTNSRCIELNTISALDLTPSRGECNLSESSATDDTLNWKVECDMTVGTMKGVGQFTSSGNTGSGKMSLEMNVQNDQFEMEVDWQARRLGPCQ